MKRRWFIALLALCLLALSGHAALAEDEKYVNTREFAGVDGLGIWANVYIGEGDEDIVADKAALEQYLVDILYAELRAKLPRAVKISKDASEYPSDVYYDVFICGEPGSVYGDAALKLRRPATILGGAEDADPLYVPVWEQRFVFFDQSDIKQSLKEDAESMVLSLVTQFYEARPDLQ